MPLFYHVDGSLTAFWQSDCQKYTRLSDRSSVLVQDATKTLLLILACFEILISATANRRFLALRFLDKFAPPLKGICWCVHIPSIIIHIHRQVNPSFFALILLSIFLTFSRLFGSRIETGTGFKPIFLNTAVFSLRILGETASVFVSMTYSVFTDKSGL